MVLSAHLKPVKSFFVAFGDIENESDESQAEDDADASESSLEVSSVLKKPC